MPIARTWPGSWPSSGSSAGTGGEPLSLAGSRRLRGEVLLDGGEDLGIVGDGTRAEPGRYRAVRADQELLEVPLDVAGRALGVRDGRQLVVDEVPANAVDLDLLEQRERHAVGSRAELGDLLRCPGLL